MQFIQIVLIKFSISTDFVKFQKQFYIKQFNLA